MQILIIRKQPKLNKKTLSIFALVLVLIAAMIYMLPKPLAQAYTQTRLDALMQSGQPVLVDIQADWCSTCKTQERVLQELLVQPEFKHITLLSLDFDQQKEALRALGVAYVSTLIVFNKGREVGRSTADQSPVSIAALLRRGL
jgi:thioredoxin 1